MVPLPVDDDCPVFTRLATRPVRGGSDLVEDTGGHLMVEDDGLVASLPTDGDGVVVGCSPEDEDDGFFL